MSVSRLVEAGPGDVNVIVGFLSDMQAEVKEFDWDAQTAKEVVAASLNEHVHWFLFKDENGKDFGTCHLQSVHNYWRKGRRYYLGAFYIAPEYRKQGRFKDINKQLYAWAAAHDGVQIYMHIHKDNRHSLDVFGSVDATPIDYFICANHWGEGGPQRAAQKAKS